MSEPASFESREPVLEKRQRAHFVGIGGIGMSGIAEVMVRRGHAVSGSDLVMSPVTDRLQRLGAQVEHGHDEGNLGDATLVVVSTAVPSDNPERVAAGRRGIPVVTRGDMLAELTRNMRTLAVVGSHGKTTTTALVSVVLQSAGFDPTAIVGGRFEEFGSSVRMGTGPFMVVEADESDRSFLALSPEIAVLTNLDEEHLDTYGEMTNLEASFQQFLSGAPPNGCVVACGDDPGLRPVLDAVASRVVTYGIDSENAEVRACTVTLEPFRSRFRITAAGLPLPGDFTLTVPGRHNVLNALAAVSVGLELGVPSDTIRHALSSFAGVDRRFQLRGEANGVVVIDDYAHHPTEIAAALATARLLTSGRVLIVFQPHRYTRTLRLLDRFAQTLGVADEIVLADVYAASEAPIPGATADALARAIEKRSVAPVRRAISLDDAVEIVARDVRPGDVVLTLGAGSIGQISGRLLEVIRARQEGQY